MFSTISNNHQFLTLSDVRYILDLMQYFMNYIRLN